MEIKLFNTLTQKKEIFNPIDPNNIRMYVCGPTVYSRAHIGNARAVVVFDILYRFLKHIYPKVTYVRNITDVDDKIIEAANKENISIEDITQRTIKMFHEDMSKLNCLEPVHEPKATEYIVQMQELIQKLIDNGNAYIANNHVLFAVNSFKEYGKLSHRNLDEMIAGSRIEVADYKKNPADFVLWKPAKKGEPAWDSPWNISGRPGWHIECSAMSSNLLGNEFDIHGGGIDLIFPHHENEIAQSECAHPNTKFARYWLHNGFLTINGEKMAKSLGNFTTVKDLLDRDISSLAIRYVLLSSHYAKPLDFNEKILTDAQKFINNIIKIYENGTKEYIYNPQEVDQAILNSLSDDLNMANIFATLHDSITTCNKLSGVEFEVTRLKLLNNLEFLGLFSIKLISQVYNDNYQLALSLIEKRNLARLNKDWKQADDLRDKISDLGYIIEDSNGKSSLRKKTL